MFVYQMVYILPNDLVEVVVSVATFGQARIELGCAVHLRLCMGKRARCCYLNLMNITIESPSWLINHHEVTMFHH